MKTGLLVTLIISGVVLTLGAAALIVGIVNNSNNPVVTNTYDINEKVSNFNIDVGTVDVNYVPTSDGSTKVVCHELKKIPHEVKVVENTLTIQKQDLRKWYEMIFNWNFDKKDITIYLPEGEYQTLKLNSSTGNVTIPNHYSFEKGNIALSTGNLNISSNIKTDLDIKSSTGDINVQGLTANNLSINASTGNVNVKNVVINETVNTHTSTGHISYTNVNAKEGDFSASTGKVKLDSLLIQNHLKIQTSTGDVNIKSSDASSLYIKASTGDVDAELLSAKTFKVETSTGKINVPTSSTGGLCEVTTSTGDIHVTIKN